MTVPLPMLRESSLHDVRRAFAAAPEPELAVLIGIHAGKALGPLWLRGPAPALMALTGMAGWYGKSLRSDGSDVLVGENLVRRGDSIEPSIPITATLAPSRVDGRAAIVVSYPPDARFPWRRVKDELRPLDGNTLLGLTFGIPAMPADGVPFVLRRTIEEEGQAS